MKEYKLILVGYGNVSRAFENMLKRKLEYIKYVFYYSTLQRTMVMYESAKKDKSWDEYFDIMTKDVLNFFHKNYDKVDVEVNFSAAVID